MSATPVIQLDHVTFTYGGPPALRDVSFEVNTHDFVSIIGPNGGGKTTLLRLFLGLLKPSQGTVRIFGQSPEAARGRVGYMAQHIQLDPQFPVSVFDVVLMGRLGRRRFPGPYSRHDREVAAKALAEVDVADLRNRAFADLSGGQRQRVLIARALACEPELLLLDEPTANLDQHTEDAFYELLRRLNQRLTILLVSHDLGVVANVVRSVICVNREVVCHEAGRLDGDILKTLYGHDVQLVHHHHHHAGHEHA